jgi:hypothetical protein
MSSNVMIIPGMNPVPTILMIEPPAAEPTAGTTAVTSGAALGRGEVGVAGDDGAVGNPDD